jgi:hypothetical protein
MRVERKVSDVVQLLCRLSEAPNQIFRVGAMGRESEYGLRTLANLGAVSARPRPDSITCQACDAQHFAALEFDAQAKAYIYFCPEAGWVAANEADLTTLRFDPEWLAAWLVSSLAMPRPIRRHALLPGRIWHLGDVPFGDTLATVVLARLISSQAALDELASMLVTILPKEKGLIVTTSPQVALQVQLPHGFAFLDLREIGRTVGSQLMVDKARLAYFVKALPNRTSRRNRAITAVHKKRREPERLDYRESDRLLITEMRYMILTRKARNPTDAARALASRAAGSGSEASKVTRLVMRYNEPP